MKSLLENEQQTELFGPDPVLMKKQGQLRSEPRDIREYRRKISDKDYLEHAIDRIAMELSHFLSR